MLIVFLVYSESHTCILARVVAFLPFIRRHAGKAFLVMFDGATTLLPMPMIYDVLDRPLTLAR